MGISLTTGLLGGETPIVTAGKKAKEMLLDPIGVPDVPAPPARAETQGESQQAAERQRRRTRGQTTRSDTILTGPLGIVDPVQGTRKTLLGL